MSTEERTTYEIKLAHAEQASLSDCEADAQKLAKAFWRYSEQGGWEAYARTHEFSSRNMSVIQMPGSRNPSETILKEVFGKVAPQFTTVQAAQYEMKVVKINQEELKVS